MTSAWRPISPDQELPKKVPLVQSSTVPRTTNVTSAGSSISMTYHVLVPSTSPVVMAVWPWAFGGTGTSPAILVIEVWWGSAIVWTSCTHPMVIGRCRFPSHRNAIDIGTTSVSLLMPGVTLCWRSTPIIYTIISMVDWGNNAEARLDHSSSR